MVPILWSPFSGACQTLSQCGSYCITHALHASHASHAQGFLYQAETRLRSAITLRRALTEAKGGAYSPTSSTLHPVTSKAMEQVGRAKEGQSVVGGGGVRRGAGRGVVGGHGGVCGRLVWCAAVLKALNPWQGPLCEVMPHNHFESAQGRGI